MKKKYKIIFTGGGSGGHTMPALAMIQAVKEYSKDIECSILYMGSHDGVEKELVENHNINYKSISTGKFRRYLSINNFIDIFKIVRGIKESKKIIKEFAPDILVSTGGFVSVPSVISAKKLNIPIIIHEQTIDAGLANKIAAKFSDKIAVTFPESKKFFPPDKVVLTGIPLRKELFNGSKDAIYKRFNLDNNLPLIYFTGGGLGSHIINITAIKILPEILKKSNVIFQTGKALNGDDFIKMNQFKETLDDKKKNRLMVFDFIKNNLPDIYAAASLAVSRSGAGTVNELMALNIPAIFIPLAISTKNEQLRNAMFVENINGGIIIEENQLNPAILLKNINDILFTDKLNNMKANLQENKFQNGTENMIKLIFNLLEK